MTQKSQETIIVLFVVLLTLPSSREDWANWEDCRRRARDTGDSVRGTVDDDLLWKAVHEHAKNIIGLPSFGQD